MHQERVTAVSGGNVFAGGRWLRAIGNQSIEAGDLVWTDGRCVYGNLAEGGEAALVAAGRELQIPIFLGDGTHCLYRGNKLRTGAKGAMHSLMVNRGSEVAFSNKYDVVDVSLSAAGEARELLGEAYRRENGTVGYSSRDYGEDIGSKFGIYFDNGVHERYGIRDWYAAAEDIVHLPLLREGARLAGAAALRQLAKDAPSGRPEEKTVLQLEQCEIIGGWQESEQDYCLFLRGIGRTIYMSGNHLSCSGAPDYCWAADEKSFDFLSVVYELEMAATPSAISILREKYTSGRVLSISGISVEDDDVKKGFIDVIDSIDLPLPDGFRLAMQRREKKQKESSSRDPNEYRYTLKTIRGEEICELDGYEPGDRLIACKTRPGMWLVSHKGELYRCRKGGRKKIETGSTCLNARLRSMRTIRKWMKGET